MAKQRLRLGIIGCGNVVRLRHIPALKKLKGIEVSACCDTDAERLASVSKALGVKRTFSDVDRLLDQAPLDAVAVCTPLRTHTGIALEVIERGYDLFLEKPSTYEAKESLDLDRRARSRGVIVFVGYNRRWQPLIQKAKSMVREGSLGPVQLIHQVTTYGHDKDRIPEWRRRRVSGGGSFVEESCHVLNLWLHLLDDDPIVRVFAAHSRLEYEDNPVSFVAQCRSGALLTASVSDTLPDIQQCDIFGRDQVLRLNLHRFDGWERIPRGRYAGDLRSRLGRAATLLRELPGGLKGLRLGGEFQYSFYAMWRDFIRCLRERSEPRSTLMEAYATQVLVEALVRSAENGGWEEVSLP